MIFTERKITVTNNTSKINKPIVLYRGDKNIEVRFTVLDSTFKYRYIDAIDYTIITDNASYAQLAIKAPNNEEPIFSDIVETNNGQVTFNITTDMIDELEEVGSYDFQIRLFDEDQVSRASIPPVYQGIEIKEPLVIEDPNSNTVNAALVDYALADTGDDTLETFDENGDYIKTSWNHGDVITKQKLNKMEKGMAEHTHRGYASADDLNNHTHPSYEEELTELKDEVANLEEKSSVGINLRKNSKIGVAEIIGVAKSYYNVRRDDDGNPRFFYDTNHTVLSSNYNANDETYKGAIDCSTYIGMVLRGIPFEQSPYSHLTTIGAFPADDNELDGSDTESGDIDNDGSNDEKLDPSTIIANTNEYVWAVNPFEWSLATTPTSSPSPVRRASQLAQWMHERGMSIPLDETFSNLEPGDIIFWAKKDSDGNWIQPNRYMHISHVALCVNKMDPPTDDNKFPSKYPNKHTMLEVTTVSPYVLNRTLEKCSPGSVVMICRPDLGGINSEQYAGNINSNVGITNISKLFRPGMYYLTSKIVDGLPSGIDSGIYLTLKVERTLTKQGKVYSLVQTLINTNTNENMYVRTQYCYSHAPNSIYWTEWKSLNGVNLLPTNATEENLYTLDSGFYMVQNTISFTASSSIAYENGLASVPNLYKSDVIWIKKQESNKYLHNLVNGVRYSLSTNNHNVTKVRSTSGSCLGALSGTTSKRPTICVVGQMYFDTTLNKPIWRNKDNNGWVDATGATV